MAAIPVQPTALLDHTDKSKNTFLNLPTELKIQVVRHLAVEDLVSVRLISSDWASVGQPFLFRDGFTLRPHRDDMSRLQSVCGHPEIAKGIKHLEIYVGDMDRGQFAAAVTRQKYISSRTMKIVSKVYTTLFADAIFRTHCDRHLLENLLPLLPSLTSITATSSKYPFSDLASPSLLAIWEDMEDCCEALGHDHFYDTNVSTIKYSNILMSTPSLKSPLQTLKLDPLPIQCFMRRAEEHDLFLDMEVDVAMVESLKNAVTALNNISIVFYNPEDSFQHDCPDLVRTMGDFLGSMQQLRSLDLNWDLGYLGEVERAWNSGFCKKTFPFLESLRLTLTVTRDSVLATFLYRHRSTLRRLHLGEDAIYMSKNKTYKDVLTKCRDHLQLEKFELVDRDKAIWGEQRIYDEDWNPINFGNKSIPRDAKLLEMFVLRKCPWPMVGDDPGYDGEWRRKFIGTHLEFSKLSDEDLDDLLGADWETDPSTESSDADMDSEGEDSGEEDGGESDGDGSMVDGSEDDGEWEDADGSDEDLV